MWAAILLLEAACGCRRSPAAPQFAACNVSPATPLPPSPPQVHTQKNGELLPGKRGIALASEQATKLALHAAALTRALAARDTAASFELSSKCVWGPGGPVGQRRLSLRGRLCRARAACTGLCSRGREVEDKNEKKPCSRALAWGGGALCSMGSAPPSSGLPITLPIFPRRLARVSAFKGRYSVDIREFYEVRGAGGGVGPGRHVWVVASRIERPDRSGRWELAWRWPGGPDPAGTALGASP